MFYAAIGLIIFVAALLLVWVLRPVQTYSASAEYENARQTSYTVYARMFLTALLIAYRLAQSEALQHRTALRSLSVTRGHGGAGEIV